MMRGGRGSEERELSSVQMVVSHYADQFNVRFFHKLGDKGGHD